jgi:hypothetical protein
VRGLVRDKAGGEAFAAIVRAIDRGAEVEMLWLDQLADARRASILYLADVSVAAQARLRLRAGNAGYALCGVTHTMASSGAMQAIADLLSAPVAPFGERARIRGFEL